MPHKFMVGQIVDLLHQPLRAAATGEYEIRRLMPAATYGNSKDFRTASRATRKTTSASSAKATLCPRRGICSTITRRTRGESDAPVPAVSTENGT